VPDLRSHLRPEGGDGWLAGAAQRLLGTLHRKLLDRVPIFSKAHLRAVLIEYQVQHSPAASGHRPVDSRL
jgi:hypothetical protein